MKNFCYHFLILSGILFTFLNNSNAQITSGVTIGLGIPNGDFASTDITSKTSGWAATGYGIDIHGQYFLNDNVAAGLNIGYYYFGINYPAKPNTTNNIVANYTIMPISLAFDYYFATKGFKPFGGIELGYLMTTEKVTGSYTNTITSGPTVTTAVDATGSKGGVMIAPFIGAAYDLNYNADAFLKIKYMYGMTEDSNVPTAAGATNIRSNTTYLGLYIGVNYKLQR